MTVRSLRITRSHCCPRSGTTPPASMRQLLSPKPRRLAPSCSAERWSVRIQSREMGRHSWMSPAKIILWSPQCSHRSNPASSARPLERAISRKRHKGRLSRGQWSTWTRPRPLSTTLSCEVASIRKAASTAWRGFRSARKAVSCQRATSR